MRCTFVACLMGDLESIRFFFQIAAPNNPEFFASPAREHQRPADLLLPSATPSMNDEENGNHVNFVNDQQQPSPINSLGSVNNVNNLEFILNDASANIVLQDHNGDIIEVSFRGRNALPLCDVVILVCDSTNSPNSVTAVHRLVGRHGDEAPALPATPPIVLLDFGTYDTDSQDAGFLDMMNDLESVVRYVGSCYLDPEIAGRPGSAFESLIRMASTAVRCPRHILWDGRSLTEVGRQALRRSFWLLDEDGDGLLNDGEISRWNRAMYGTFTTDDVNTVKAYAKNTEASYIAAGTTHARGRLITEDTGHITVLGYLAVCHIMLAEGRHEPLWVMLAQHGVGPDALPHTDDEIERAVSCEDPESMLHLSPSGISFFASLYSRQRFAHPSDLFLFTPDCPWSAAYGLPNASEVDLPVHDFVSCWRYMAVVEPAIVAKFARYWAFGGDLATLFSESKMRPFRRSRRSEYFKKEGKLVTAAFNAKVKGHNVNQESSSSSTFDDEDRDGFDDDGDGDADEDDDDIPPTAIYLVLGSPQCGKTSLMQRIADNDSGTIFADDIHPSGRTAATSTVRARLNNDGDMLVAMRELDESEVDVVLSNTRFMNTIAGILFCFDTSEPYSLSYLSRIYPLVASQVNLPIVVAMCKSDLPVVDQLGLPEGPRDFCLQRNIMWPPVFTSLSHLRALPGNDLLLNDVDNLTFILAEVAVNPSVVDPSCYYYSSASAAALDNNMSSTSAAGRRRGASEAVGFWRTMKRAFFLALLMIGLAKLVSGAWRRYDVGDRVNDLYSKTEQSRVRLRTLVGQTLESSGRVLREGSSVVKENVTTGAAVATTTISATLTGWANKVNEAMSLSSSLSSSSSSSPSSSTTVKNSNGKKPVTSATATAKSSNTSDAARRCPPSSSSSASKKPKTPDLNQLCKDLNFDPEKFYQPPNEGEKAPEPQHHLRTQWNNARKEPKRTWARHSEWHD